MLYLNRPISKVITLKGYFNNQPGCRRFERWKEKPNNGGVLTYLKTCVLPNYNILICAGLAIHYIIIFIASIHC